MHPDAEVVYSPVWDAHAPYTRGSYAVVCLVSKRMNEDEHADAERADEIARLLVNDAYLSHTFTTKFNRQAVRLYKGSSLTELAIRRDG